MPTQTPTLRIRSKVRLVALFSLIVGSPALVASDDLDELWSEESVAGIGVMDTSTIPEVLTTTRLRQPKTRVPGTTTIITGEMIRELGLLSLAEVFRLVPGMTVAAVGSNQPVVSYHGTVAYQQRRLQVLVDGRTAYMPSLADVDWNTMPVPLELIDRIEVSRGPNSAAYGINAFLASINIITLSPEDSAGTTVRVVGGDQGYRRITGTHGRSGDDYSWRLSYQRRESDGFDYQVFEDPDDGRWRPARFHNGFEFNQFNYDSILNIDDRNNLELRAGVTDGIDEKDRVKMGEGFGAQEDPDTIVDDYYLQARWNHQFSDRHRVHLQSSFQRYDRRQRWRACVELIPGQPEACGDINEDLKQQRLEFEIQDTLEVTPDLRLVSGVGYREDGYESETFFNGSGHIYQARVFANLEYTPVRWLTLNTGGNWEKSSLVDDQFFSPRVAANFHLTENQTVRFVFSKAVRTPDALEQRADWGYVPRNVSPDAYSFLEGVRLDDELNLGVDLSEYWARADGDLKEETIISREISYYGQFRLGDGLFSTEVRYFYDHIRDMVAGFLNVASFDLGNRIAINQQGFEIEAAYDFANTRLRASYGYMDQDGEYRLQDGLAAEEQRRLIGLESRLTARHSGSLSWIQRYSQGYSSALSYYFTDEFRSGSFERADLRLAKSVHRTNLSYDFALIVQHYLNDNPLLSRDNNFYDRNHFFLEAGVRF